MPMHSFLKLNRGSSWFVLPLGCALAGCASDASTARTTERAPQPSASDVDADDDSKDDHDDDAVDSTDSPRPSALDGALAKPASNDAGASAPRLDAGTRDAARPFEPSDAATTSAPDAASPNVASDGSAADAAVDAGAPPTNHDAGAIESDAQTVAPAHTFKVDSKDEWTASGFRVEAGRCYAIDAKIDERWLDLDVPADLAGWIDKGDVRLVVFEPFRRVAQDDIGFYQFATCVDKKLSQCFPVDTSSNVCPKSAGELFFFVNDVPGFESNNVGTATVTIQAR